MYLLKSSIWLTGFGLIYLTFLRNERYFLLNRIFLLAGLVASIVFPLLSWHYIVVIPTTTVQANFEAAAYPVAVSDQTTIYQKIMPFVYLSGVIYLLLRIFKQTTLMLGVIKKSGRKLYKSVKLIRTNDYSVSFSFFSYVFVNPSIHENELDEIVNHELEHVRQRHWIDLVLFEILCALQWFNPMIWIYGRSIRQNHEYLADERALKNSSSPALYRAALLNQLLGGQVIALAHSFNYSLNTKRFDMMKSKMNSPIRKLKLLVVFPLIAMVFYAFASPEYVYTEALSKNIDETSAPQSKEKSAKDTIKTTRIYISPLDSGKVKKDKTVSIRAKASKSSEKSRNKEQIRIGGSGKQPLIIVNGKEVSSQYLNDINPNDIESIDVLKDQSATALYGEKGRNGVVHVLLKEGKFFRVDSKSESANSNDSKNENKTEPVTVVNYKTVVGYQMTDSKISSQSNSNVDLNTEVGVKIRSVPDSANQGIQLRRTKEKPLIVIDGVITTSQDINDINPNDIHSIKVWKNDKQTKIFGKKGKNGVIEVTTKKGNWTEADSKFKQKQEDQTMEVDSKNK